jgi:alkanesulfonate monooxygenase SsuD/methylene tetrahydromethanopterin reductase-like flavin-dependent oxidoreductase (luciferase family)
MNCFQLLFNDLEQERLGKKGSRMKYGINVPNFNCFGDAARLSQLAREAEEAGWDGFFIWDHIARPYETEVVDPWIALACIAMKTTSIRIGTMVTPLPRRRPWKVARETVSIDRLSNGRFIFGVGIGSKGGGQVE